ncbi:hypothetical protein D3C85_539270 [compost metagenome]
MLDVLNPERHVRRLLDIEPRRRLVEQQQLGLGAQRARQLHHLAHAVGQPRHHRVAVVLQVEQVDHLLRLLARRDLGAARGRREEHLAPEACLPVRVAPDQQVVQHRRMLEQLDVLEGARNAQRGNRVRRLLRERDRPARLAMPGDLARGRRVDAADQVEHRRLARAVRADEREHLAAPHVEAHLVDRQHAAEAHAQVFRGKKDVVAHLSRSDLVNDFCRLNKPLR